MIRRLLGTALVATIAGLSVSSANAAPTTWAVQAGSSALTISGALSSGGTFLAALQAQSGTGLTTTFGGTIQTEQTYGGPSTDAVHGSPGSIQFVGGSLIANDNGNWDPLPGGATGTAPGNYGGKVDLGFLGGANLTIRGLVAGLTSQAAIPLVGTAFNPQTFVGNIDVTLLAATADYRGYGIVGGALGGGTLTDGVAGQSGTVSASGGIAYSGGYAGTATLTIPVNFSFAAIVAGADTTDVADDIGVFINLLGSINATALTAEVPEASSLVLLGLAGSVVGFAGYRRKSSKIA